MGVMYARNKLQLVDDVTGQTGVKESKLTVLKSDQPDTAK